MKAGFCIKLRMPFGMHPGKSNASFVIEAAFNLYDSGHYTVGLL